MEKYTKPFFVVLKLIGLGKVESDNMILRGLYNIYSLLALSIPLILLSGCLRLLIVSDLNIDANGAILFGNTFWLAQSVYMMMHVMYQTRYNGFGSFFELWNEFEMDKKYLATKKFVFFVFSDVNIKE